MVEVEWYVEVTVDLVPLDSVVYVETQVLVEQLSVTVVEMMVVYFVTVSDEVTGLLETTPVLADEVTGLLETTPVETDEVTGLLETTPVEAAEDLLCSSVQVVEVLSALDEVFDEDSALEETALLL